MAGLNPAGFCKASLARQVMQLPVSVIDSDYMRIHLYDRKENTAPVVLIYL
jgi:hypothetical protein